MCSFVRIVRVVVQYLKKKSMPGQCNARNENNLQFEKEDLDLCEIHTFSFS